MIIKPTQRFSQGKDLDYNFLELMELLSYVATVIGIPLALAMFIIQEQKERQSEQQEIYDQMMEHYARIQDKLFQHPDYRRILPRRLRLLAMTGYLSMPTLLPKLLPAP